MEEHLTRRVQALSEHFAPDILYDAFFTKWNVYNVRMDLSDKVRTVRKKTSRNALSRGLRRRLIKFIDQEHCIYCGSKLGEDYEIDHFLAVEQSLQNDSAIIDNLYNLFTSCVRCNRQKHDSKYSFMYKDVIHQRQEFLYSMFNDLWLSRRGRQALKRLFRVYDEILEEMTENGGIHNNEVESGTDDN